MSVINSIPLIAAGDDGYQISRSVRLRSSASAYLNRTPASAGNRKTWTWSGWVKRGKLGSAFGLIESPTATAISLGIDGSDTGFITIAGVGVGNTTAVFRDPSAWYHVVIAFDTTQATSANRVKFYVNSVQYALSNTLVSLNTDYNINSNTAQEIGITGVSGSTTYFDGYLTEINFIDGQALTPSSFGETNAVTGVWQPKKYGGTYGTNGFYLNFSDNSTAAALGTDFSGNSNTWTVNNISVTAGVTYDSMLDVPTPYADGGNGRGNYCVLNPLNKGTNQTIASGNLSNTASGHGTVLPTIGVTSGLWYAEVTLTTSGAGGIGFTINPQAESSYGEIAGKWWCYDNGSGFFIISQTTATASLATKFSAGQVWQWAIDTANGKLWIGLNNSWFSSAGATTGNPATGANPTFTFTAGTLIWPILENAGGPVWNANFGQRPFTYTPPTGYVALNTQNLPAPTISNGASYMAATTYTGTGSALTIANTVGNASFQPDLVWVKGRSGATDHAWYDAVRGVQKQIESNTTTAETTETTGLTAFGSTGFTVGALAQMNTNAATYVGWQWNAGGSTVTNTSGTISAQVRANPTAGFSVVGYTGTGANATVGHGLGVAPSMIITKVRSTSGADWGVYHTSIGNTKYLLLNTTAASATSVNFWNNTSPTSAVFSVGIGGSTNNSGNTMIAYCFSAVAGYSKAFSYTGNGSSDGTFVYLGFRPRWIMVKRTDSTGSWYMWDTSRDTYNWSYKWLAANLSDAENTSSGSNVWDIDILSNGFKIRNNGAFDNASGGTYIGFAVAENPFKLALAR